MAAIGNNGLCLCQASDPRPAHRELGTSYQPGSPLARLHRCAVFDHNETYPTDTAEGRLALHAFTTSFPKKR